MKFNDRDRAVTWAREHWHVTVFMCAALVVIAVALVYLNWMSPRAAWSALAASIVYVVLITWLYTGVPRFGRKK